MTSSSFLSLTLAWTKTRPLATTGELLPSPMATDHWALGACFQGATFSGEEASRLGPSHCGQSPAVAVDQHKSSKPAERSQGITISLFLVPDTTLQLFVRMSFSDLKTAT